MREPRFENLLKVLRGDVPDRPTLFEFYLNAPLYRRLSGMKGKPGQDISSDYTILIPAFQRAGYDYATLHGSDYHFPHGEQHMAKTRSLNEGGMIHDRASFEAYPWPDPDASDYTRLERCPAMLPPGMKIIVCGPGGVLENVIALVGYETLCLMILDEPELAADIFAAVGQRLIRYYEICAPYEAVGALISNDDWGFNRQTMLSPEDMRRFVFPWHRRIVAAIHDAGKPVILHSCGNLDKVLDDIIAMGYDGKHSYEDNIQPVEEAYEKQVGRIATLGGIDLDFVVRSTPAEITARSAAMLERARLRGGYALGTGNSVPEYVPDENYFAMIAAAGIDVDV